MTAAPQEWRPPGQLLAEQAEDVAADWRELCRWDPMLPPDAEPPLAVEMVAGIAAALERPQPVGWGPDPSIEDTAEAYATAVGGVDLVVGQMVCLRAVLARRLSDLASGADMAEYLGRLHMVVDRAMQLAVHHLTDQLRREAFLDPLTGLLNRRALDRDLRREASRADRYGRQFSLLVIDLVGLKRVNDTEGHLAGDLRIRMLANSLNEALRTGDSAYRIGGDEFLVLLPETADDRAQAVAARIEATAPPMSWGAATFPDDGQDLDGLVDVADRRLFEQRRSTR